MRPHRPRYAPGVNTTVWMPDLNDFETVLGEDGISDLLEALADVSGVPGDLVECGSWRGGSAMILGEALRRQTDARIVYACDSYEGFDLEELRSEREAGRTGEPDDAFASTSVKYVEAKIRARGLEGRVVPVKGYFAETLVTLDGPFAMALIDCDLPASILFAARTLWPRLSPGGLMLFDDYLNAERFSGARVAVDEFRVERRAEIDDERLQRRLYRVRRAAGTFEAGEPATDR